MRGFALAVLCMVLVGCVADTPTRTEYTDGLDYDYAYEHGYAPRDRSVLVTDKSMVISIDLPQSENETINRELDIWADNLVAGFVEVVEDFGGGDTPGIRPSLNVTYEAFVTDTTESYVFTLVMATGGLPVVDIVSHVFDASGVRLDVFDVLPAGVELSDIATYVVDRVQPEVQDGLLDTDKVSSLLDLDMGDYDRWAVVEEGIVLWYPPTRLGSTALGGVRIDVLWTDMVGQY